MGRLETGPAPPPGWVSVGVEAPTLPGHRGRTPRGSRVGIRPLRPDEPTERDSTRVALHRDEWMRMRAFLGLAAMLAILGTASTLVLAGNPTVRAVCLVSGPSCAITCLAYRYYIRDPRRYRPIGAMVVGLACVGAGVAACRYYGMFSPAPMVFVLLIYALGSCASRVTAWWPYTACALVVGGAMVATAAGWIDDPGVIGAGGLDATDQLVIAGLVQVVYATTLMFSRVNRATTLRVVASLERALEGVRRRDTQLREAQEDLERARGRDQPGNLSGQTISGWSLGDLLGRGGNGDVYDAERADDGQVAAVKVLNTHIVADRTRLLMFAREAALLARINSPHVVRVFDVGDAYPPFIAMERLVGQTLGAMLRARSRLESADVVRLVGQVGAALEAAREAGIVHRDIKPQNLFLTVSDGRPLWKVLDFGISTVAGDDRSLTRGAQLGTPGYMAPEQITLGTIDHGADVFGLAAVAYRALTGHAPFPGSTAQAVMYRIVHSQPVAPSTWIQLPRDVELVLALGLCKDPTRRVATASELTRYFSRAHASRLDGRTRARAEAVLISSPWQPAL